MIVLDEAAWQEQLAALESDETGREVRKFLEAWIERAEDHLNFQFPLAEEVLPIRAADAVRWALPITEQELGVWNTNVVGQMLAMIILHWGYSNELLVAELTTIEHRLLTNAMLAKVEELNKQAQEAP